MGISKQGHIQDGGWMPGCSPSPKLRRLDLFI